MQTIASHVDEGVCFLELGRIRHRCDKSNKHEKKDFHSHVKTNEECPQPIAGIVDQGPFPNISAGRPFQSYFGCDFISVIRDRSLIGERPTHNGAGLAAHISASFGKSSLRAEFGRALSRPMHR